MGGGDRRPRTGGDGGDRGRTPGNDGGNRLQDEVQDDAKLTEDFRRYSGQTEAQRQQDFNRMAGNPDAQMNPREKKELGAWLSRHYGDFDKNGGGQDGKSADKRISRDELAAIYSKGQWPDGTKLNKDDFRLLRKAAENLDNIRPGGTSADKIDRTDVEGLQGSARVVARPDGSTVSNYQDGTTAKARNGFVMVTRPDRSAVYRDKDDNEVSMNRDGTGALTMNDGGKIALEKQPDGSWAGRDKNGNNISITLDQRTMSIRANGQEIGPEGTTTLNNVVAGDGTVKRR